MLREKCVEGITANEDVAMGMVTNSIGIVTALLPFIGYANASEAAKVALAENKGVAEVVVELGYLNQEQVDTLMRPAAMTQPQEDAGGEPAASSVDVVGGGQYSGYHAWQANKDISGVPLAHLICSCASLMRFTVVDAQGCGRMWRSPRRSQSCRDQRLAT
eukprot:COSAG04_NODE_595_length_12255_cov_246.957716_3_plen_161_part_00